MNSQLMTCVQMLVQLSSRSRAAKRTLIADCVIVVMWCAPTWLAPAPARHVTFAMINVFFVRFTAGIASVLYEAYADAKVRPRARCQLAGGVLSGCHSCRTRLCNVNSCQHRRMPSCHCGNQYCDTDSFAHRASCGRP